MKKILTVSTVILPLLLFGCYADSGDDFSKSEIRTLPIIGGLCPNDYQTPPVIFHQKTDGPRIMVMGDSRANCGWYWTGLDGNVYNIGWVGTTIRDVVCRLQYIDVIQPKIVIIFGGVNDITYVSPAEFAVKLAYIHKFIVENRGLKLIMLDPINPEYAGENMFVYRDLMAEYDEFYNLSYQPEYFKDMGHLNLSGYEWIKTEINNIMAEW